MIKCVLFDLDGTIIDSEEYTISSKKIEGKKLGYDIKEEDVIGSFGMSRKASKEYFASIYGEEFPYDELSEYRFVYIVNAMKDGSFKLMPYAKEIISFLKANNIKVGLCTSSAFERVNIYKKYVPLLNEFEAIVTNDMVKNGKPFPEIFLTGMEKLNCLPCETIVVEDAITGVKAGLASGATTIMVPQYIKPDKYVLNSKALVMDSLNEVINYVKKVNNIV